MSIEEEARRLVKKALGEDIDFSVGTVGHTLATLTAQELVEKDKLRAILLEYVRERFMFSVEQWSPYNGVYCG